MRAHVHSQASDGVNGPLLEALAASIGYHDAECIQMFRIGAPLASPCFCSFVACPLIARCFFVQVGALPLAGNGKESKVSEAEISVHELDEQRDDNNSSLLMKLREDMYADKLLQV